MRYVISANKSRMTDAEKLGQRIRNGGYAVRYIFVESVHGDEVIDDAVKELSYDDDIMIVIPKYGVLRRWPLGYSNIGNLQIKSGVYGF